MNSSRLLSELLPERIRVDAEFAMERMSIEDAPSIFRLYSNASLTEHMPVSTMVREEDAVRFLDGLIDLAHRTNGVVWKIVHTPSATCIGLLDLLNWDQQDRSMSLAYALDPHYWGQGVTTRALAALLVPACETGIRSIFAAVMRGNEGSVRVLTKNGFVYARTQAQGIEIKGFSRVVDVYALLLP